MNVRDVGGTNDTNHPDKQEGWQVSGRPRGTVTFLFTDIEGSTRLWHDHEAAMQAAYVRHDVILSRAISQYGGVRYKVIGDAFQVAFPTAIAAVAATLEAQLALAADDWVGHGLPEPLRVRMALHVGAVDPDQEGDYRSPVLNRLGRLLGAGHGGQILLSQAVMGLVQGQLPNGAAARDLGAHRLKDLLEPEHIWQLMHPGIPGDFPPLATLDRRQHNLPLQPTPLIGREREVAEVIDLIRCENVRLLTLTGPGGTGKTRLSLQVASEVVDGYPDGVWFVPLAPLMDPGLVPSAIASVLNVREGGGQPILDTLMEYLRGRRLLLLLDNAEHLLAAVPVLSELLASAAGLNILVTSRFVLRIAGEHAWPVPPLGLPPRGFVPLEDLVDYPAVALFIQRARAAKPDFALDAVNAPAVIEIGYRLDGLPLTIELAAARVRLLTPQAMLKRLENRLQLLTSGGRDRDARQQTLRGAIEWSYHLLPVSEQILFVRLGVFTGGWTLESADAVCNRDGDVDVDVLDGLAELVDKSFVVQQELPDGDLRFMLLETLREFALEYLQTSGQEDEIRARHAAYFAELAAEAEPYLTGPRQVEWLNRLAVEHPNIRASLAWLASHQPERGLELAGRIWRFWYIRSHFREGQAWYGRLLAAGHAAPATVRRAALYGAGVMAESLGDAVAARAFYEEELQIARTMDDALAVSHALSNISTIMHMEGDLAGASVLLHEALELSTQVDDQRARARALIGLGRIDMDRGQYASGAQAFVDAAGLMRSMGDVRGAAAALGNLGVIEFRRGNIPDADQMLTESLAMWRQLHDAMSTGIALLTLADVASLSGRPELAVERSRNALTIFQDLDDRENMAIALGNLCRALRLQGDLAGATQALQHSIELTQPAQHGGQLAESLEQVAAIMNAHGDCADAAQVLSYASRLRTTGQTPLPPVFRVTIDREVDHARHALGETQFAQRWDVGQRMGHDALQCLLAKFTAITSASTAG